MSAEFDGVGVSAVQFELDGNFASASCNRVEFRELDPLRLIIDGDICFAGFVVQVSQLKNFTVVIIVSRS
jgi:hypothetical protein